MIFLNSCKVVLACAFILPLVFGCSTKQPQPQDLPQANVPPHLNSTTDNYWWRCQFRIQWRDGERVNWAMDSLLAHAVVAPTLKDHYRAISYWRFHRRAARDTAGHQFSFIFYSTPDIAKSVYKGIQQNKILHLAIEADLVKKVIIADTEDPKLAEIKDTSDPNWPLEVQKSWPAFIMGVSSFWLGLIDESMQESPNEFDDINLLLQEYREVDVKITETWRYQGQHALLHHLNAIFGYNPLFIRKMLTF